MTFRAALPKISHRVHSTTPHSTPRSMENSRRISSLGISLVANVRHLPVERPHGSLDARRIVENVAALLGVDARDTIQEVALQAEGERGARVDDLLACLVDLDLLDGLAGDYLGSAAAADRGHPPGRVSWIGLGYSIGEVLLGAIPDGGHAILAVTEDCYGQRTAIWLR